MIDNLREAIKKKKLGKIRHRPKGGGRQYRQIFYQSEVWTCVSGGWGVEGPHLKINFLNRFCAFLQGLRYVYEWLESKRGGP